MIVKSASRFLNRRARTIDHLVEEAMRRIGDDPDAPPFAMVDDGQTVLFDLVYPPGEAPGSYGAALKVLASVPSQTQLLAVVSASPAPQGSLVSHLVLVLASDRESPHSYMLAQACRRGASETLVRSGPLEFVDVFPRLLGRAPAGVRGPTLTVA